MISIALASYNGEKYIREQLDSILNQTIQDFEVIICDDCSNDNTWNIIEEYANNDARFRCYKNEKNLGFIKNFEKAISLCEGDYVALCDQDDIWIQIHLEVLFSNIKNNNLCLGNALFINGNNESLEQTHISSLGGGIEFLDTIEKKIIRVLFRGNFCQGASMLIKRDFLNRILPVPNCFSVHDVWFAMAAICEKSFVFTPETITLYRQHNTNVINRNIHKTNNFLNFKTLIKRNSNIKKEQIIYAKSNLKLSENVINLMNEAIDFHSKRNIIFRLNNINRYIKYYPYIYMTRKKIIFRIIKYIIFGL